VRISVRLLGGAVVEEDGTPVGGAAAHRHALALLAVLAVAAPAGVTRGRLVGLLWPESPEKVARNRLNTCLHRLRKVLGSDVLISQGGSLRLNQEQVSADVRRFQEALDEDALSDAVQLYRGPFLDGFWISDSVAFDGWMDRERDRLARSYRDALESLARRASAQGDPGLAVRWWHRVVDEAPADARASLRLMEALSAAGRRSAALQVAQAHATHLEEVLQAEPDPQVQALAQRIRHGDATSAEVQSDSPPPVTPDPNTVAVLPFEVLGGGEESGVLAAGLHHDLLTELSRAGDLKVISRTSVLRYRDGRTPVREIARALGAGTVVEGGLQQSGGRIRLNVQLIDGVRDEHRWAESYDRDLTAEDLFQIQSQLAGKIAQSLRAELIPEGAPGAHSRASAAGLTPGSQEPPTTSLEAYRLQVQGRAHLDERTEAGMVRAVEFFRAAIQEDPEYPLAWVGLADGLTLLFEYTQEGRSRRLSEAEAAARRALELSPGLGEAHASLGLLHEARHEGPQAIREHTRAVELRPGYADAHNWLSWTSQLLGRPQEALAASRRAVELNPLSPEVVGNLGVTHLMTDDPVTALRELGRARALQPDEGSASFYEALTLHRLGRTEEAREILDGLVVPWAGSGPRSTHALLQAAGGHTEEARSELAWFEAQGDAFATGLIRLALGDRDGGLAALGEVERWTYWPTLAIHYHFPQILGPLRDDGRLAPILASARRFWGLEPDGSLPDES
jgi:DNA-binding SARP family transcriptional activator/tetratricopeptide (TPR) repeat protein